MNLEYKLHSEHFLFFALCLAIVAFNYEAAFQIYREDFVQTDLEGLYRSVFVYI